MVWQLPVSFYKYIRREKIMKKIVALLMTAVMTIGMATAAFAAPSPQPTTGTIVGGKNASGQDVDLSKVKNRKHSIRWFWLCMEIQEKRSLR